MSDLISRKALIAEYDRVHVGPPGGARKLMENAPAAVRWVSVADKVPERARDYLCRCVVLNGEDMAFYMVLRYILFDENPHFQHETKCGMRVTHWMPLPEPPKEE